MLSSLQLTPSTKPSIQQPIHKAAAAQTISNQELGLNQSSTVTSSQTSSSSSVPLPADDRFVSYSKLLLSFAWQNILSALAQFSIGTITFLFVGRLGVAEVNGAAIAGSVANLTTYSVGFGLLSAVDSLCSQAYGAKQYQLVGLQCQRAMIIVTLFCLPMTVLWLNTASISRFMGMTEETAHYSGVWNRYQIFGMWANFMFDCLRRFQQSQGVIWPIVTAFIVTSAYNAIANYLVANYFKWGFTGHAVVNVFCAWCLLFVLSVCVFGRLRYRRWHRQRQYKVIETQSAEQQLSAETSTVKDAMSPAAESPGPQSPFDERTASVSSSSTIVMNGVDASSTPTALASAESPTSDSHAISMPKSTSITTRRLTSEKPSTINAADDVWPRPSVSAFKGWAEIMNLAIPGAVSQFIESGSFEGFGTLAGQIGSRELAVHGIFAQTVGMWGTVPGGIGTAPATLIGNYLGGNKPVQSERAVKVAIQLVMVWCAINGTIFCAGIRPFWGAVYSQDAQVIAMVSRFMPILFAYGFLDAAKNICATILRGTGRQQVTVYANILGCLFTAYPLGVALVFVAHKGVMGLWGSITIAWFALTFFYVLTMKRTDWQAECDATAERTRRSMEANKQPSVLETTGVQAALEATGVAQVIEKWAGEGDKVDKAIELSSNQPSTVSSVRYPNTPTSHSTLHHTLSGLSRTQQLPSSESNSHLIGMVNSYSSSDLASFKHADSHISLSALDGQGEFIQSPSPIDIKLEGFVEKRRRSIITQQQFN